MKAAPRTGIPRIIALLCAALLSSPVQSEPQAVSMDLQDLGRGMYRLEGRMTIPTARRIAWNVLSDYERIHHFVSSMRRSEVKQASDGRIFLEQEALGKVFVFSKKIKVILEVREQPMSKIVFEDIAKKDFIYYAGSWQVLDVPQGVEVVYRLDCQRRFKAPNFIAKDAMRKAAEDLLADVGREMIKRSQEAHSGAHKKGTINENA